MAKKTGSELNDKQRRFAEEYVIDMNGKQAAIRAGYSPKTAEVQAVRLLGYAKVQTFISELRDKAAHRLQITFDDVLNQYRKLAFQDIRKFYNEDGTLKPIHELDDDAAAALAGVDVDEIMGMSADGSIVPVGQTKKIKRWDPIKALEAIGKHLGFFEQDNKQKQPPANIGNLSPDDLLALASIQKKTAT